MDRTQFTKEELAELKKSSIETYFDGAKELPKDYTQRISNGIAEMLRKTPQLYLCFGVYWWDVKRALNQVGKKGWWNNPDEAYVYDRLYPTFYEENAPDAEAQAFLTGMIYMEYNQHQMLHEHYRLDLMSQEPIEYYLLDSAAGL